MPVPVENGVAMGRLPAGLEATAYFVVAEALTNVAGTRSCRTRRGHGADRGRHPRRPRARRRRRRRPARRQRAGGARGPARRPRGPAPGREPGRRRHADRRRHPPPRLGPAVPLGVSRVSAEPLAETAPSAEMFPLRNRFRAEMMRFGLPGLKCRRQALGGLVGDELATGRRGRGPDAAISGESRSNPQAALEGGGREASC